MRRDFPFKEGKYWLVRSFKCGGIWEVREKSGKINDV